MPVKGIIQVWNHEGNQLEGPVKDPKEFEGGSDVYEYQFQVRQPYDPVSKKIQGEPRISDFRITKEVDRLTPLLLEMTTKGNICKKVVVTLFQINQEGGGKREPYFTYTMEQARISDINDGMQSAISQDTESTGHTEDVSFIAEKHIWEYLKGGIKSVYPPED